jgi:acyl-coenzyme A thioesterase PaaI-like protein
MMVEFIHPYEGVATQRRIRKVERAQNISRMCLVCGRDNALGLRARFYELEADGDVRELLGVFTPRDQHQSYPGRLHGGVSSAILDETIGRTILLVDPNAWGVTVELSLRYRRPLALDDDLRCLARLTRDTRRLFEGSGEILLDDGSVAVEAHGKYFKQTLADITDGDFESSDWLRDPRTPPSAIEI